MTTKTICARDAKKGMITRDSFGNIREVTKVSYDFWGVEIQLDPFEPSIHYNSNDDLKIIWNYSWEEELLIHNPLQENGKV